MKRVVGRLAVALAIVSLAIAVIGCDLPFGSTARGNAALRAFRSSADTKASRLYPIISKFPSRVGTTTDMVPMNTAQTALVKVTLETRVEKSGTNWSISFIESWDAGRYHHAGDPYTGIISHTWQFIVDGKGKVVLQRELGYLPPQYEP